jgi:peptide/nickel transport system ATP-binding protein
MPLLEVKNLQTHFFTDAGVVAAVGGVDLSVEPGKTLAIVGESGCGKSMTAHSILRLVPDPPGRIVGGEIWLEQDHTRTNLLTLSRSAMRAIRGGDIAMIFQEPMTSLNPVMRIGEQIGEALRVHRVATEAEVSTRAEELLQLVGIPEPRARLQDYPHQLSGGMRQRVMIAMALACNPRLLIADEPTTALDVTIQAQILQLLRDLQQQLEMGMILITHDLGIVAAIADEVVVMYAGRVVEQAPVRDLFAHPQHPYTQGLLRALPTFAARGTQQRLNTIPGRVPHLAHLPQGCAFQDRCSRVDTVCRDAYPALEQKRDAHFARCYFPGEE